MRRHTEHHELFCIRLCGVGQGKAPTRADRHEDQGGTGYLELEAQKAVLKKAEQDLLNEAAFI